MDWTGGVRRRFAAGKNNALVQKQKAHFAKVRATLQNTPSSQHTFRPDLFDAAGDDIGELVDKRRRLDEYAREGRVKRGSEKHRQRAHTSTIYSSHRKSPDRPLQRNPSLRCERQRAKRASSVVSISPGTSASSSPSSRSSRRSAQAPTRTRQHSRPLHHMAEDEQLLTANRRRLLARTDWLGLAAARPVQMKFSSYRDKDQIGKRRKVEKSGHRAKPAGRRLLTPLFEERLLQPEYLMSGALPADDIRIRIGTDALASQTQRSRQSHTPANASVRQASTEFGPLSEESMLLDADGDGFETEPLETTIFRQRAAPLAPSMAAMAGSQLFDTTQYTLDSPDMRPLSECSIIADEAHMYDVERYGANEIVPAVFRDSVVQQRRFVPLGGQARLAKDAEAETDANPHRTVVPKNAAQLIGLGHGPDAESTQHSPNLASAGLDADDETWRRLMNIQKHASSHVSMAALRSSSQHNTTSDSSHRPSLCQDNDPAYEQPPDVSTPRGLGTQTANVARAGAGSMEQSTPLRSPSASLRQIMRLAQQPTHHERPSAPEEPDDNALWKQFIVGSDDGSSDTSQRLAMTPTHPVTEAGIEERAGLTAASSFEASGLWTSDRATNGELQSITSSTRLSTAHVLRKRKADTSFAYRQKPRVSQASMIAQPERVEYHASTEDSVPADIGKSRATNIHASVVNVLNPKQYKKAPPSTKKGPATRKASGFLPSRKVKTRNKPHSVYDLVDSDGLSLA